MIVAVYVNDMNLIWTPEELVRTTAHLKSEFEMQDLKYNSDGILVHQLNYTQKVLRHFNEDKVKPSSTSTVVRLKEDDEEILEPEVPYLSEI